MGGRVPQPSLPRDAVDRTPSSDSCPRRVRGRSVSCRTRPGQGTGPDGFNVANRRKLPVADRDLQCLNWAESAPTGVASGRTGVRAKAAVPLEREIAFTA